MRESIIKKSRNCWILAVEDVQNNISSEWFNDKYWLNQGRLLGASSGRGSAWMVKSEDRKMMLRHFYRGGLPAKFNKDKYFWSNLENTRSFKEFRLLVKLADYRLPAPLPVAAQVCKKGLFYQANILIEYIPNTRTFADFLNTDSKISYWQNIGKIIAEFHKKGVCHSDLNANNILLDTEKDKVYLIDFDNSGIRSLKKSWQKANLKRLKRSVDKLSSQDFIKPNQEKWQNLTEAYYQNI